MTRFGYCAVLTMLLAVPRALTGQDTAPAADVRIVEFDDGMSAHVYAYVRAASGPIVGIDERGITFNRDPALLLVCLDGAPSVVYRFDTGLLGEDGAVRVQYRFGGAPSPAAQLWPVVRDPTLEQEMEMGVAFLAGESASDNPLLQMFGSMVDAARVPPESVEEFLAGATKADEVTLRVTDQTDGESHTDVFPLRNLSEAAARVREACAAK
jgi:hypothetical protein